MKVLLTHVLAASLGMLALLANDVAGENKRGKNHLRGEFAGPEQDEPAEEREMSFSSFKNNSSAPGNHGHQKIVGGSVANARPWFVEGWGCGGTLVWKDFVLTAAHCWDANPNYSPWAVGDTVYIGNTKSRTLTTGSEKKKVKRIIRYPSFNEGTMENDYMLVQLDSVVQSTRKHLPLNGNPALPAGNSQVTTMGFGTTSSGGSASRTLLQVTVKTYSQSVCSSKYGSGMIFESNMFCAGADAGGKDSCQGDSGGPIVDINEQTLLGIVSWGEGCGSSRFPGVYARVSFAKSWIDKNICTYSVSKPTSCSTTTSGGGGTPPTNKPPTKRPTKKPTKRPTPAPVMDDFYYYY